MTQKIFLYSLLIGICFLSCFNTPKKGIVFSEKIETQKDTILSKEEIYKKIEEIVNLRIADKKEGKESLSYYFSKLNIEDISSYKIKTIIGRLIEFTNREACWSTFSEREIEEYVIDHSIFPCSISLFLFFCIYWIMKKKNMINF